MKIIQISDTHMRHRDLKDLPDGDILIHCGDFSHQGTEEEVLDFLNWFIDQPHRWKLFVTGNHDACLWDADGIEDLPNNVIFMQNEFVEINGVSFFGLGFNEPEALIPNAVDVVITHEPPLHILDQSGEVNWGHLGIRQRIAEVKPMYHLFGHAHEAYGMKKIDRTVYSNASILDNRGKITNNPRIIEIAKNN